MDSTSDTYIFGRHPVREQLLNDPGKIEKIFLREGVSGTYVQEITSLASQNRIPVNRVPGKKLFDLVGKVNDQGIVALTSPVTYLDFDDWLESLS
ncbi:MAG: RNA methyltransferase substrate-binding domain-containing protein, partial [Balneolaceae bacterium]